MLAHRQAVQYIQIKRSLRVEVLPDVYQFRADRGWLWFQRLCFWILGKIGARREESVEVFRRTPQENGDLLKSLFGQRGEWLETVHREKDGCRIYMGPDDRADLMRILDKNGMSPFTLNAQIDIRTPQDRYGRLYDVPITVVPWMQGAVLVPTSLSS